MTATSDLTFTTGDVGAASAVLTAAAEHLIARDAALWPPASLTPERLARHYPLAGGPGEGWVVAWREDRAVGCFVLLQDDPLFWPDAPRGEALYLHKLAVHPAAQGQGLAQELLKEAVRRTRAAGQGHLRLDTASARPKLRAVYEHFGFRHVTDRVVQRWEVSLYDLPLPALQRPDPEGRA